MTEKIEKGNVKVCAMCGKTFIPTVEWMYRRNHKFYCRYTCYTKAGGDSREYKYTNK